MARATAVGADTALAQIVRLVQDAQAGKVPMQRLADRISAWFIPIVLLLAAATFTGWLLFGPDTGRLTMAVLDEHRGAHHRLPLRARPRHPDRDHGRDGPGAPSSAS